ncbi:MAG: insulinase family protein, partial [Clostridia bacterium]|nr:insulinase family protein [Clostridia bacterium]
SATYAILSVNFGGNVTEYERNGERVILPEGCAHFLEHKLFDNPNGTNADDVFSSLGAYCNAYTSNEKTAYLFSTTENEERCLEELIYFVTNPYFTDDTVKKEIGIISQEIRGCIDDPYDRCYIGMLEGMYKENPVKKEICGSEESISRITPEVLYRCCEDFYTPSNMLLCVSGRMSMESVLEVVDKVLEKRAEPLPDVVGFVEPREVANPCVKREMPVGKPIFTIGVKDTNIPTDSRQRYKRAQSANILLNSMFSEAGEFYSGMLDEGLISPGFDVGYSASATTGYIMMSGESDCPERVLAEIKKHIEKTQKTGIDSRDFEREKKCMYSSYISEFDVTEDIAFSLTSYTWEGLDVFSYPEIISEIRYEDVMALCYEMFKEEYFTLSVIYPQREES